MFFLHWVTTYNDVTTELLSEDREEALRYIDNDQEFDAWLKRYAAQKKREGAKGKKPKGKVVSKEDYMKRIKGAIPNPSNKTNG